MARLFTSAFSNTLAQEGWSPGGTPTLVTSPVNSAGSACQINALSEQILYSTGHDTSESSIYVRIYVNVNALPTTGNARLLSHHGIGNAELWRCTLTSTGTLQAQTSGAVNIGSASSALTLDTWYVLETRTLRRAAGIDEVEARVYLATDQPAASFVTDTGTDRGWGVGMGTILISSNEQASTFYVDDVAINDTLGGSSDSWPGPLTPTPPAPRRMPLGV